MRNYVAKNDFNRASVHPDRSKEPQYTLEDGLGDYLEEMAENALHEELGAMEDEYIDIDNPDTKT